MNRRRTKITVLGAVLASALAFAGCGGDATGNEGAVKDDGSVDLSKVTLIVGDQKGGSKALLQAAGELDDVDYKIEWKEFTSGPPLLEALNAGAIHVGGVGNTPPLFAAAGKSEIKVVQGATYGGAGDAIVVPGDSPIKDVSELKGKTVGVAEGSSANYNLLAQLQDAGLKYSDVTIKNLQPGDALAAFSAGHLDAWAIWEPFTSQAEQEADAKVIADGSKLANGYTFQVASDVALDDPATKEALSDYLSRIAKAQVWSQTHQEDWAKVWAEETGLSDSITLAAVKKRQVQVVPIDQTVIDSEQEMADSFADNDLLPGKFDVAPYFIDDFNDATTGKE
ncbi:ABC transporter substrate-binding protein [Nocardioides sp. Root1257]|uniref:ABC transporter substrate-binding protein n=1 Tax=unclassified Nocardioides TaxID=2615069 RepID=UPI00070175D5|nr:MULTISPECIES: ABC transporter substrate-binding protein [unclassified Nocardioides]KQW43108.1 ABC transporter substrate-binding protein [Nocardioides sp. Root1257]KRC41976.1 ABC transporter substrate-binding protein [Nocardioides sp. Root224]